MARVKAQDRILNEQAEMILSLAESRGVQSNYFFRTTFQRYQMQLQILADLEKDIKEKGITVEKTLSKNASNDISNPSITAYNKTSSAANQTVVTLMKIINGFAKEEDDSKPKSKLESLLMAVNGDEDEEE